MINFKNKLKGLLQKKDERKTIGFQELAHILENVGIDISNIESSPDYAETIYFICLKHLAETVSKMPWEKRKYSEKEGREKVFDNDLDILLNVRPNPYMSAVTFWGTVELNKIQHGNAYIYIETDKVTGKVKNLWQLPSENVEVWIDDGGILESPDALWYIWTDKRTGKRYSFFKDEIIHIKNHMTLDGLVGMPVREILKAQINTGKNAVGFLNKFYKSGMFGSKMIVHYTGNLEDGAETKLVKSIEKFSQKEGTGRIIPLPLGFQAQMLDMKLADAQFFENNKMSALQLAAAFGIKPNIINDYSKSSFSNSESQQLDFYVNTLQPLFKSYEQEVMFKLLRDDELKEGMRIVINEKMLFKMDNKTQAEVYTKYLTNFVMTPNEVREELDLPYVETEKGGDKLIGNGNAITLDMAGKQYRKGGVIVEE